MIERYYVEPMTWNEDWHAQVVDSKTQKRSLNYGREDALQLCKWLNDRETGYVLSAAKMSAILGP